MNGLQEISSAIKRSNSALLAEVQERGASSAVFPDIREFIKSDRFCGESGFWEKSLLELEILCSESCKGGVIEEGIRGGKSFKVCRLPCYFTCKQIFEEVVLGKDPRGKFGLAPHTVIYNAIFTINQKLARKLFVEISQAIESCKWLKEPEIYNKIRRNPNVTSEIQFCAVENGKLNPSKPRYVIYPGHSKLTSAAGVALFTYILDECNLFTAPEASGECHAEALDIELDKRVTSSFGLSGKRIYISRRDIENDFTQRKIAQWSKDPGAHSKFYLPQPKTSWGNWPEERNTAEKWRLFSPEKFDWERSAEGDLLPAVEHNQISSGFWVPERFWTDFTTDPEGSLRVLGSIPAGSKTPYFRRRDLVSPDYELRNPIKPGVKPFAWMAAVDQGYLWSHFDSLVEDWFVGDRREFYHFHVDLALSRSASGDAAGLTVVRNAGFDEVAFVSNEGKPERCVLVDVEICIQIKAPPGGEVVFSRVREIIYWLSKHRGFRFLNSSYDGWQSIDSIQTLNNEGFEVEVLSVDGAKSVLHYNTLKQGIYEGRVCFPPAHGQNTETTYQELAQLAKSGDSCAILQIELLQLELVRGKKIDHPSYGSKDVADSLCGAVSHAVKYIRPGVLS